MDPAGAGERWVGANEATALPLEPSDAVFWKEWVRREEGCSDPPTCHCRLAKVQGWNAGGLEDNAVRLRSQQWPVLPEVVQTDDTGTRLEGGHYLVERPEDPLSDIREPPSSSRR